MSENFYYYLIYPENNYDNKCFFSCFCIYFSWKCLFSFSGNIYYLFCLELPNTNHFVRKTTLVNNTRTWPAQRHSALSITLSDQQRHGNTIKSGILLFQTEEHFLNYGGFLQKMSTHFIWVPLQVSKRLLSTQCPHSQNVHFKRKFFPTNLILFFPRISPIMYVSTSSDSGYRFLNICMFTIYVEYLFRISWSIL